MRVVRIDSKINKKTYYHVSTSKNKKGADYKTYTDEDLPDRVKRFMEKHKRVIINDEFSKYE